MITHSRTYSKLELRVVRPSAFPSKVASEEITYKWFGKAKPKVTIVHGHLEVKWFESGSPNSTVRVFPPGVWIDFTGEIA